MTVQEYLTLTLSKFNIDQSIVELIAINQSLNLNEKVKDINQLKTAIYKEFYQYMPVANISEGGYSLDWNYEGLKLYISGLAKDLGFKDPTIKRTVRVRNLW